ELSIGFLAEHGIAAGACARIADLDESVYERAGCIVLVEEAINEDDVRGLRELLARQPAWSDMPLVLVAGEGAGLRALVERAFPASGTVTLPARPLSPLTLVSAVQVGLRARAHQLQVRSLLESREQALRARDNFLA